MKQQYLKRKSNIWFFIFLLTFGIVSCRIRNSLLEKNTVWQIITEDSVYYEFYYDINQQFIFDGKYAGCGVIQNYDTINFNIFLSKITRSKDLKSDSAIIHSYFSKYCRNNVSIINIKPIGSFFYRISSDQHDNYMLYSREAYKRWRMFLGFDIMDNNKNDSLIIYDEFELR